MRANRAGEQPTDCPQTSTWSSRITCADPIEANMATTHSTSSGVAFEPAATAEAPERTEMGRFGITRTTRAPGSMRS